MACRRSAPRTTATRPADAPSTASPFATGFDEVLAHRRLLDSIGGLKVLHHRAVVACRKAPHHLVPDALLQRPVTLKQFVAPQALFAIVAAAQSRPLDRYLLAIHHAVAVFLAPAMRAALLVLLVAFASPRLA